MERAPAGVGCPSLRTDPTMARGWLRALRNIGRCYYEASQVAVRIHYNAPWLTECADAENRLAGRNG